MPSVWIRTRATKDGGRRYRVEFRLGGRESKIQGGLAARRVPDITLLKGDPTKTPTLVEAAEAWRASRVDVGEQTANMHRSSIGRIFKIAPHLRTRRIAELEVDDVTALIVGLTKGALQAGDDQEDPRRAQDNPRFPRDRPEPGQGQAGQDAEGAPRMSRRRSRSTSSGSRDACRVIMFCLPDHRRVRPQGRRTCDSRSATSTSIARPSASAPRSMPSRACLSRS